MAGKKKSGKRRRHQVPLEGHRRDRRRLIAPFNDLPNIRPTNWITDFLPELIFAAAMLDAYDNSPHALWAYLEALDPFVPDGAFIDGHISTFAVLPEERRASARVALVDRSVPPLPDELLHALALYPECPGRWLIEDWANSNHADPDQGIPYLKRLVAAHFNSRNHEAARLRFAIIGRHVKAGKIHFPPDFLETSFIPRYPDLEGDELAGAESEIRAMYGAFRAADSVNADARVSSAWCAYFWRQNYKLSACEEFDPLLPEPVVAHRGSQGNTDERQDGPTVGELRAQLVKGGAILAEDLRREQAKLNLDLYDPTPDEVRLGLAGRQVRLLRLLLSDAHLWSGSSAAYVLRAMVDGLITSSWLLHKNDPALYAKFRAYGLGKLKLYKLHLENHLESLGDSASDEQIEFLDQLEEEVASEILESFIDMDIGGNFAGVDARTMAIDAGLKPHYDLAYQPHSSEAHGDWVSLKRSDLRPCANPLHRYHLVARFGDRSGGLHLEILEMAAEIAEHAVTEIFASFDADISEVWARFYNNTFGWETAGA